jgi:hypothetical protein
MQHGARWPAAVTDLRAQHLDSLLMPLVAGLEPRAGIGESPRAWLCTSVADRVKSMRASVLSIFAA